MERAAVVIYEYLITIDREVETVWWRTWTASSLLLLSTRWVMVLSSITQFITPSNVSYLINAATCYLPTVRGIIASQLSCISAANVQKLQGRFYLHRHSSVDWLCPSSR